jgi:hypothetical protein
MSRALCVLEDVPLPPGYLNFALPHNLFFGGSQGYDGNSQLIYYMSGCRPHVESALVAVLCSYRGPDNRIYCKWRQILDIFQSRFDCL